MTFDEALTSLIAAERVHAVLCANGEPESAPKADGRADPRTRETIGRAAGEVLGLWATTPLGEILPGLTRIEDQPVEPEDLRASSYYALYRADLRTWGQLATLSAPDLRGHHNIGPKTLHAIAEAALWHILALVQGIRQSSVTRSQLPGLLTGPPSPGRDRIYSVLSRYVREPRLLTVLAEMLYLPPGKANGPRPLSEKTTEQAVATAARMMVHTLAEIPMGDALPGLYALNGKKIDPVLLGPRNHTTVTARSITDYGQIACMRPRDLPLSTDSAHAVLAAALREIITGATAAFPADPDNDTEPAFSAGRLDRTLGQLAWWAGQHRDATRVGDMLHLRATLGPVPPDLQHAWEQATSIPLSAISAPPLPSKVAPLISELLGNFDDRRRTILTRRVFTTTPATFAALSTELGLSRERIRALESHAISRLRIMTKAPRWAPLRWRAAELRHQLHEQPPTELNDALHDLTTDVPDSMRDLAGQLLLWLANLHKIPFDLAHNP